MAQSYSRKDGRFMDYRMEQFHGEWFRGPLDRGPDAIAWLGAAQTFGRLVDEPFPEMVGGRLHLGTLNLGSGGKSPQYYLRHPELLDEVNRCRVAVVQIMSARGCDNSLFRSDQGGARGVRLDKGTPTRSPAILQDLISRRRPLKARRIVRQTQQAYVHEMGSLLRAIRVPKVLLWISFRPLSPKKRGWQTLNATSPQLVSDAMVSKIEPLADQFIAVVSRAGIPQVIHDEASNVVRTNWYYPSPEMHRLAADELTPVVGALAEAATAGTS
jgi:Domain of unknown function (DUF6473)